MLSGRVPLAVGSLALAGSLSAAQITVDSADDVSVGAADGNCTLRSAVASADDATAYDGCASGSAGLDEIVLAAALDGATVTLSEGQMLIEDDLTITGPVADEADSIVIDAGGGSRHFDLLAESGNEFSVDLAGMTLTGGATSGDTQAGGAIRVEHVDLTLNHVVVHGNSTVASGQNAHGGAISVRRARLEIHDSEITSNSVADGAAGGGVAVILGELEIHDTRIADNELSGSFGRGGGLSVFRSDAVLDQVAIVDNAVTGDGSKGGGLSFRLGSHQLDLTDSLLAGNTIDGNDGLGAGLYVDQAMVSAINTTFSGNAITGAEEFTISGGGGIRVEGKGSEPGQVTLVHASLVGNQSEDGADGIDVAIDHGQVEIHNSLVVQQEAGQIACAGPLAAVSNSLATDATCTGSATSAGVLNVAGLADNGGPTRTHRLRLPSAAIDAAGKCPADFGLLSDQRGLPRPGASGDDCDAGAFELQDGIFADRFDDT
jgi:hypothetical protein